MEFIALLFLIRLFTPDIPKCPALWSETKDVLSMNINDVESTFVKSNLGRNRELVMLMATSSYDFHTGRFLGYVTGKKIIDTKAVEHNKKVEQCKINNGEF